MNTSKQFLQRGSVWWSSVSFTVLLLVLQLLLPVAISGASFVPSSSSSSSPTTILTGAAGAAAVTKKAASRCCFCCCSPFRYRHLSHLHVSQQQQQHVWLRLRSHDDDGGDNKFIDDNDVAYNSIVEEGPAVSSRQSTLQQQKQQENNNLLLQPQCVKQLTRRYCILSAAVYSVTTTAAALSVATIQPLSAAAAAATEDGDDAVGTIVAVNTGGEDEAEKVTTTAHGTIPFSSSSTYSSSYSSFDVTVVIRSAQDKVGLELSDIKEGTTTAPQKTFVYIKRIIQSTPLNRRLERGMILVGASSALDVQKRLRDGPYPVQLTFRSLAAGGDAISDLGTPIVSAQDALNLAVQTPPPSSIYSNIEKEVDDQSYSKTILSRPVDCAMLSRRGDVLEIVYEARVAVNANGDGRVYDASETRGTGQPYQMVLGSGDMLPGVDLGLYDMCPGESRRLEIPPRLAYGLKGNQMFRIPPSTRLVWNVTLITVNSVTQGDPRRRTRDDMEGRVAY